MALELLILKDPCREISKHRVRAFGEHGGEIGRAPDSFWVLPDPKGYVSSHHCSITYRDGVYWLRDSSRNGVFLNGSRVPLGFGNEVPLRNDDRLRIAEYEVVVRLDKRPVRLAGVHPREPSDVAVRTIVQRNASAAAVPNHAATEADDSGGFPALESFTETVALPEGVGAMATRATDSGQPETDAADTAGDSAGTSLSSSARNLVELAINRMRHPQTGLDDTGSHLTQAPAPAEKDTHALLPTTFRVAAIDHATMERHAVLLGVQDDAAVRAFKILRTRVRRRMTANHWRSVGITGSGEGVGKTMTSINLALSMAQDNRSPVFLVDMDLNRPHVGTYFGMKFDKGLTDYLLGEATLEEIVYSPGVDGLAVIPNGRALQHSSELLHSPRMGELVSALEAAQPERTILYDLPPILMSDDVLVFTPHLDCVIDVVAVGITPRASRERSRDILGELNVVGIVLNRATGPDNAGHYYYY
jgi:Mrp family chromosome partitioning ATPase/pSer/pThr/pTyr-binding forkhead associated (FHA) protein